MTTIGADELKQMVDRGEEFVLVDVREAHELEEYGTLAGYIHIPIGELADHMAELPKDKKIVLACERAVRAGRGAALLAENGFQDVVATGLVEYRAKHYPLVYQRPAE